MPVIRLIQLILFILFLEWIVLKIFIIVLI